MKDASNPDTVFTVSPETKSLIKSAVRVVTRPRLAMAAALRTELKKDLTEPEKIAARGKLNNDMHPGALNDYLDSVDPDWINWVPETIYSEIESDSDQMLGNELRSKIMAIQTARTVPEVSFDPLTFENIVTAFNDHVPEWSLLEKPPLHEIVFAILEIKKINPHFEMTDEVRAFIEVIMRHDNIVYLPWIDLSAVNDELSIGIKGAWKRLEAKYDPNMKLSADNPVHVQVDRLFDIKAYLDSKENNK